MNSIKTIALFGTYDDSQLYSRNIAIKKGLVATGYNLVEFRPKGKIIINKVTALSGLKGAGDSFFKLLKQWLSLFKHTFAIRKHKVILVPYPSHADIILLKLLLIGKSPLIISDAFLGLHSTIIEDRKLFKQNGLASKLISYWEKTALRYADIILLDTNIQCQQLHKKYNLPITKFIPIPVGIDESIWCSTPISKVYDEFRVVFWGTFIPLHGIQTIIDAAVRLEKLSPTVIIQIIGTGQTALEIKKILDLYWPSNLRWINQLIPIKEIVTYAKNAHCILGIFGESTKAASVIPYKIYQALAINRPVITRESDIFNSDSSLYSIYTVQPGSSIQLAEKIHLLATNAKLAMKKSSYPRQYFDKNLSQDIINKALHELFSIIANN